MIRRLFRISFLFISVAPQILHAADQRALLELTINEVASGEVSVLLRDADVLIRLKDLQAAGLKTIEGRQEAYPVVRPMSCSAPLRPSCPLSSTRGI